MLDDRSGGIARWRRVADALRQEIADGSLIDRIPPESRLAQRFGVNRHTVRRAIAALADEGLLRAEQGRGTFVNRPAERLAYPVGARTRFSENIARQQREPGGRLIKADQVSADARLASILECRVGAPLHRLETLHVADGVPLSVSTSWFLLERFPNIVQDYAESGSITRALEAAGLSDYRRRETRLTAERATPNDAQALSLSPDGLVMVARAVDIDLENRPIQALRTRFSADWIELVFRH